MPLYEFEYSDDDGITHVFEDFYPMSQDFTAVMSPCGKYKTRKLLPSNINITEGMTANQKKSGTTKKRIEMGKFMQDALFDKRTMSPAQGSTILTKCGQVARVKMVSRNYQYPSLKRYNCCIIRI
jgi:hypothetical protein